MKYVLVINLLFVVVTALAQDDRNLSDCEKAKKISEEAAKYQGFDLSQQLFDRAIELCPTYDYAYSEKSVPYLKRGEFIEWKRLIDKAVEVNPKNNLGDRGWCKFQFLRDYQGAIDDIESLDSLVSYDVGYSMDGSYHLNVVKALSYKMLGEKEKAIQIIEDKLNDKDQFVGIYDYLHLGVLYLELGGYSKALECFDQQIKENDYLAETYYYKAVCYKKLSNEIKFAENIEKAKQFYIKGYSLFQPYTELLDKVYYQDIIALSY